jgi:hypothetical protein
MKPLAASLACALLVPAVAHAAPSGADAARADALFREGLHLFESGQTAKACARFDESYQIDPALGTLQNLALCHEKEGKLVASYDEFTQLSSKARDAGKTQRADVAREHLAALETKVARVVLQFPDGLPVSAVEVDGVARDWRAPIALDVGHHVITAHADGRPDARAEVDAPATGGSQPVAMAFPAAQPQPTPAAVPATQPVTASAPNASPGPPRVVMYGLAGLGAAGVVVGSVFGILTFTQKSAGDSHCSGAYCDASGLSSEDAAHTSATVSTVAFAVGLAALAVDAVLLFTRGRSPSASARVPARGVAVGAGGTGGTGTGVPGAASLAVSF